MALARLQRRFGSAAMRLDRLSTATRSRPHGLNAAHSPAALSPPAGRDPGRSFSVTAPALASLQLRAAAAAAKEKGRRSDPFRKTEEEEGPARSALGARIVVIPAERPPDVRLVGITP